METEDRQGLVRSLFEYVVYDLDSRRIVDFQLKAWADKFVVLRASLYDDEFGDGTQQKKPSQVDTFTVPSDEVACAPYGNRTRVFALRGRRPRPLDEWSKL